MFVDVRLYEVDIFTLKELQIEQKGFWRMSDMHTHGNVCFLHRTGRETIQLL